MARYFQSGLCGCCDDCGICCLAGCCPHWQMGINRSQLEDRECTFVDCICADNEYHTRQMIRRKFNMEDQKASDCFALSCCYFYAIMQDGREIKIRMNQLFAGRPPVAPTPPAATTDYESTLFGCMDDIKVCLFGAFFLPCLAACTRASVEDREAAFCDFICCPNVYHNRRLLRQKYNFPKDNQWEDCAMTCFCMPCAECQNAREANLRKQRNDPVMPLFITYAGAPQQQTMVVPAVQQGYGAQGYTH